MSAGKYGSWTIESLKSELKKRNAKVSGRKKELVDRLEAYDRNFNFGQSDNISDNFTMDLPDKHLYSDLNSDRDFPSMTMQKVTSYLEQYDKTIEKVSKDMFREKFLLYARCAKVEDTYFVRSACRAEMSKSLTYKLDISVDSDGFIKQCQCECAAGMGPNAHCKHICTLLFAGVQFSSGKPLLIEQTCTEQLQRFHHVKRYHGSPLKSGQLEIDGANIICETNFDPRPSHLRNLHGYTDYFRNVCLSNPGISTLPIHQIFTPANNLALAHDHDYFINTHEENFLANFGLKNIDSNYIEKIESKTREQSVCKFWAQERCKRLCSSSYGRICKLTEQTNKVKLAQSFLKPPQKLKAPSILHGKKYESVALKEYEKIKSCKVSKCGLFISETHPFLATSPDGIVKQDTPHLVEIKCPYASRNKYINEKSVPYLIQDGSGELTLKKKHDYFYQIQGQLYCTDLKSCDFVVYTLCDIKIIKIDRDDEFISLMIDMLIEFYEHFFCPAVLDKHFYKLYDGDTDI